MTHDRNSATPAALIRALTLMKDLATVIGMAGAVTAFVGVLTVVEGLWARQRLLPSQLTDIRGHCGLYGSEYDGDPLELALLGDSLAVGVGARDPEETVGVLLARGLASAAGRPVQLRNVAVIGSESKHLAEQIGQLADAGVRPAVAVIIVGGNEVMHLQTIAAAVEYLSTAVRQLRGMGCHVVVATCPDMGTVRPFIQPLRFFAHWLSRVLATAQTIVVLRAGGRTVSLADTLGPVFRHDPKLMFSSDHLHPSSEGYGRAAEVLLPSVCAAAGYRRATDLTVPHRVYQKDRRRPLAWLAFRAVRHAGTEAKVVQSRGEHLVEVGRRTLTRFSTRRTAHGPAPATP